MRKNLSQYGDAWVCDNAVVIGNAWVGGTATVCGNATVSENATVIGNAVVCGNAVVSENAIVSGNARISGNAEVSGNAIVSGNADYIVFKNWWSSGGYFTWTRSNNKWRVGCFYGRGEELIAKAFLDSEKSGREYERVVNYVNDILKEDNDNGNRNKLEDCPYEVLDWWLSKINKEDFLKEKNMNGKRIKNKIITNNH